MADCEEHDCKHRYYRLDIDKIDFTQAKFELLDTRLTPATVAATHTGQGVGNDAYNAGYVRAKAALEKRQGEFFKRVGAACPGGCRCPASKRPADSDPAWTKTPDMQAYRTDFVVDRSTYRVHFDVPEYTADVSQPCKPNEEEISWIPSNGELALIEPAVLSDLVRRSLG